MSMPESDDDDSMNDLLSGSISSTPTPGGPVVERTATCNVLLAEKPRARLRWKPTTIVECTNKKGRTTQSVPFLEDLSNWMDIRLAHQVLTDKPFQAPHGKTVEKWKVSAFFLARLSILTETLCFPMASIIASSRIDSMISWPS